MIRSIALIVRSVSYRQNPLMLRVTLYCPPAPIVMTQKSYYRILGISVQASTEQVRLAYRRLARRYHPDISGEDDAEDRIREINEAYAVLADPERRRRYDRVRQTARHQQKPRPKAQGHPSSRAALSSRETLWTALADFTKRLATGAGRRPQRACQDAHATITLTLEEAYHGGQKEITLNDVPDGSRRLIVHLPAGLAAGQHLRLRARAPCTATGVAGDLYLRVELAPHHRFRLVGPDLYIDLPITPWEAALGTEVAVPTLDGETTLNIPAGSQGGQYLRLKERGWPGSPPGDQYVKLALRTPAPKTACDEALYRCMAGQMPFDPRADTEAIVRQEVPTRCP